MPNVKENKKIVLLAIAFATACLFLIGAYVYKKGQAQDLSFAANNNYEKFVRDYSPWMGPENAKVTLVEYLDPECEACRAFYPYVKQIVNKYKEDIKLVVRYAPFHKNSRNAIAVLEASRKQGKYWEALELMFMTQSEWADHHNPKPEMLFSILPQIGIDVSKLKEDMKDPKIQEIIKQDHQDLKDLGVKGTPTFFVNGVKPESFGPQALEDAIAKEIEKLK